MEPALVRFEGWVSASARALLNSHKSSKQVGDVGSIANESIANEMIANGMIANRMIANGMIANEMIADKMIANEEIANMTYDVCRARG